MQLTKEQETRLRSDLAELRRVLTVLRSEIADLWLELNVYRASTAGC